LAYSTADQVPPDGAAEDEGEKQGRRAQAIDIKVESNTPSPRPMNKFFSGIFYFPILTMLKWLSFSHFLEQFQH
jgi:hypothetical protein